MIKTKLGNYSIAVTPECHQSHMIFRVEVPESTEELVIHYSYSPTEQANEANLDKLFSRFQKDNNMASSDREYIRSVRNLITVSAKSSDGFEGSCHRFESIGKIVINGTQSTPGMLTGKVHPGFWDISFNFHALVTEKAEIQCTIEAIHSEERTSWQPIELAEVKKEKLNREKHTWQNTYFHKIELHSHTLHSDARQSANELIEEAVKRNFDWLAITDHNTLSAFDEINPDDYPIQFIKGLEMTTLHGHFLTLGYGDQKPVDWTSIDRVNINEKLREMKEQGLLIGIAHPFDVGSPYCTGCRWQYALESLEWVDFIEVWNSEDPHLSMSSADAIAKWTQLLNSGIEIPATCGRDWHHSDTERRPAYFYVSAEKDAGQKDILEAIKLGRSYITLSPRVDFRVNGKWSMGDRIHLDEIDELDIRLVLEDSDEAKEIIIESNLGDLYRSDRPVADCRIEKGQLNGLLWLRATAYDENQNRVMLTNPIYFES